MVGKRLLVCAVIFGIAKGACGEERTSIEQSPIRQAPRILNAKDRHVGRFLPDVEFQDLAGKKYRLSDFGKSKAIVIATTSTSCPLSKRYFPTIVSLANKYHPEAFEFILINPIATDKPDANREAARELGLNGIYVHDIQGTLSSAWGLTSTTDVLLLDPSRTVRYQGAIDDQYGFGYSLDAPRKSYLISAIDDFLKELPIVIVATEAPGCHLTHEAVSDSKTSVTYHNRISRIIQANCGECHRNGGVAPFSLETYADLVAHAKMIETVVNRGTMPPWFAVPVEGQKTSPWINDCSLDSSDKQLLLEWLKNGKAQGDSKDAPLPVKYPSGWTIGKPDLLVQFPTPIPIKATGTMRYKHVSVETELSEDKWVQRIEVRPGAPEVVHHILMFVRPPRDESRDQRGAPGDEINYWGIYVPGNSKQLYPNGFARKLPKGSQIHFQIHYTPNGKETQDLTQAGFVFADKPPVNEVKTASLINAWFEIPPGASNYEDSAKFKLLSDVTVLGFLPHMHLRGKACRYEAITPDGQRETLLDIPHYDFNWQILYRYGEPRTFSKGTTLKFNAVFDNSDKNPANPDPTATVRWGEQTYDEMIVGYIEYYVPVARPEGQLSENEQSNFGLEGDREEMLFMALDANDDGKLSIDELKKLSEFPRFKQANPLMIGVFFVGLDKDHDGFLSLDEFRNIRELFKKKK
jgi:peroxiredoxin